MDKSLYKPRILDHQIDEFLETFGAVCIEGPKWCGKTWTSSFHSKSEIYITDPAGNFQNRRLAQLDPSLVLEGERPRLIDEWQEVTPLWDAVRFEVDKTPEKGQFILTGSATPNHKGIFHSGAGRIARIRMRPMSLYESGHSSGVVSLKELCDGKCTTKFTGEVSLKDLIDYIIRGGWPNNQEIPIERASRLPNQYLEALLSDDIERIDGIKRDRHKMELLLRSLARNESTTATNKRLKDDIKEINNEDIVVETVASYLDVLNRLFLIDNQKPYSSELRSSVRVKQAEKRHLADPSLACALLDATPQMLINDLNTLGFLFEALCERDLRIYAQSFGAELYHYQDYSGKEMDSIVALPDGQWCGFEIKLGANQIDEAADNLLKIKESINQDSKGKTPKVLCVLCGMSSAAYQRPDGVFVVPLTALAP
jgi:uncharacterized protein